ncbi:glutathione peroxidase [Trichoderma austrokoningii]
MASATNFYEFKVNDATNNEIPLSNFKGKVVLVVNTASKCGLTYQYKGLESIYQDIKKDYADDFIIIGFPCNQFAGQEPGTNEEIQNFCSLDQKVTFPVFAKINVNGNDAHPLYSWMKRSKPGLLGLERVKWNFEKFLISRNGKVVERWASTTEPEKIQPRIIEELKKPAPAS